MDSDYALLTDFYELTMANGYLLKGIANKTAVFNLFFARHRLHKLGINMPNEEPHGYVQAHEAHLALIQRKRQLAIHFC